MLWEGYSFDDATWEPAQHISDDMIQEFVSPPPPSQNECTAAGHVLCCKVLGALASSKEQVIQLPMSRAVFRHLFTELDGNAASNVHHPVNASEFSERFGPGLFKRVNSHGQG